MPKKIIGFSKLSREEKIKWLSKKKFDNSIDLKLILDRYPNTNEDIQRIVFQISIYHTLFPQIL